MKNHPDRNPGDPEAEAQFKAVGAAYEVLKDPQKRAAYDQYGHAAFQQGGMGGGGHADFGDIGDISRPFSAEASVVDASGRRAVQTYATTCRSAWKRFDGKKTQIEIEVSQQCDTCNGSGAEPGTGTRMQFVHGYGKVRANQGLLSSGPSQSRTR